MHEHGLGDSILHALEHRFPEVPPGGRLLVCLRASEISGLRVEPLQQAMHHAHESHESPPVVLRLRCEGLLARCAVCDRVVEVDEELTCPDCGGGQVALCAGDTVLIEEVQVLAPGEEPPPGDCTCV